MPKVSELTTANALSTADSFPVVQAGVTKKTTVGNIHDVIQLSDYTALRAFSGTVKSINITGYSATGAPTGIGGLFTRDDVDTSSADNGGTIIVDASGRRWKRVIFGDVHFDWFQPTKDGAIDDTTKLATASNFVSSNGGGRLLISNGIYGIQNFTAHADVEYVGESLAAVLRCISGSTFNGFLNIDGTSNVTLRNLSIDLNEAPGTDGSGVVGVVHKTGGVAAANDVKIVDCSFFGGLIRPYYNNVCSIVSRGLTIRGNIFLGKSTLTPKTAPANQTSQAIRFLTTVAGCGNFTIENNRFKFIGLSIQIRSGTTQQFDWFDTVTVAGNQQTDVLDDPNISTSPYELYCITGLVCNGNVINSGGRGFNGSFVKSATYSGNTAYDQSIYFFEMANCDGVTISGNTAYNCKTFINETSLAGSVGSKNINIVDNTIAGGSDGELGFSNYQQFANIITMVAGVAGYQNWVVRGNVFVGLKWADAHIRIDGADLNGYTCEDNVIIQTEETARPNAVNYVKGSNVSIKRNRIYRPANITDVTANDASTRALITLNPGGGGSNVEVDDNTVSWTGSDNRTGGNNTGVIGIGANTAAAALAGVKVRRNTIIGAYASQLLLQINSGDTVVTDNDLDASTGTVTLNSAIVYRRTRRRAELSAAPTTGAWSAGDVVFNSAPNGNAGIVGWICTIAGTPGTWAPFATVGQQTSVTGFGDADATLTPTTSRALARFTVALTANRTVTLSTTNAWNGARFKVIRAASATGAFTLSVGGLKTLAAASEWAEVTYDGTAWVLTGYGTL